MDCPESFGALPAKGAVGAVAVIILSPLFEEAPGFRQGNENILVQAFITQPSVETFHETVICGFPWPTMREANALFLRPFIQGVPCKLRAIVRKKPAWQASLQPKAFQHLHHPLTGKRYVHFQGWS